MSDFITVNVSNSQNDVVSFEKRFPKDIKISELKRKLEIITGGSADTMQLQLFMGDKLVAHMNDGDDAVLGAYPIQDNMRIHVVDSFQNFVLSGTNVEKFELSENQYDQKRNTVRDFLKQNKLGKYNAEEMKELEQRKMQEELEQLEKAKSINIGDRCMVTAKGPRRIGTVRYVGPFKLKPGIFIGVEFDEPLGIHDGCVDNHRYFTCKPKYGSMAPINCVEVGDFPPEIDGLDDDEI